MSTFSNRVKALLTDIAPITGAVTAVFIVFSFIWGPNLLNWRDYVRYVLNPEPLDERLVVITLDDAFAKKYNYPEITPRQYLADLVNVISTYNPKVIALDYMFVDEDVYEEGYDELVEAVHNAKNVILPSVYSASPEGYELDAIPTDTLKVVSAGQGYANILEGIVRETRLNVQLADRSIVPSFPLAALHLWFNGDPDAVPAYISATNPWLSPITISYKGFLERDNFLQYKSEHILNPEGNKRLFEETFNNKLILIGSTFEVGDSGDDEFDTSLGSMFGIEIHANIVDQLLREATFFPTFLPWYAHTIGGLIALCIVLFWLNRFRGRQLLLQTVIVLVGWVIINTVLYAFPRILLPLKWPLMVMFGGSLLLPLLPGSRKFHTSQRSISPHKIVIAISDLSETARQKLSLPPANLVYESQLIAFLHDFVRHSNQLNIIKPAALEALKEQIQNEPDVVHLIAPVTKDNELVLQTQRGAAQSLDVTRFCSELDTLSERGILIIDASLPENWISECEPSIIENTKKFGNDVHLECAVGVIVLSPKISTKFAAFFCKEFYTLLGQGVQKEMAIKKATERVSHDQKEGTFHDEIVYFL